ncbi:MAG: hypothetical protein IIT59_06655 [Rhodocyclaceae bacterium]|nr:hypothetical protein [Rhodocyclaceae bacterium]
MRLEEACRRFNELASIKFGDLFSSTDMNTIIINKGKTGQRDRVGNLLPKR